MDRARVRWTAPATADEVGRLRRAAAVAAREHGLDELRLEHLELALSEALTNIVRHAYPDTVAPGPMSVELEADDDGAELRVIVSDAGGGMAPRAHDPGLGLGLGLLATAADRCEIRTDRVTGTQVTMAFALVDVL
jgi:anti-sigma regulatory factor (Ser/Thr protein kinase)